jgi:leucyl/phenylalanyl-tRNA--protein transferase
MPAFAHILAKYLDGYYVMYDRRREHFYWDREPWRAVIPLNEETDRRASRMLSRIKPPFEVVEDLHTDAVLAALCDDRVKRESWLRGEVLDIYREFRRHGRLKTIEALRDGRLAGSVLAITLGRALVAETMFGFEPSASKACLCYAVLRFGQLGYDFIDVQQEHPPDHPSARLGEQIVGLRTFLIRLRRAAADSPPGLLRSPGIG